MANPTQQFARNPAHVDSMLNMGLYKAGSSVVPKGRYLSNQHNPFKDGPKEDWSSSKNTPIKPTLPAALMKQGKNDDIVLEDKQE